MGRDDVVPRPESRRQFLRASVGAGTMLSLSAEPSHAAVRTGEGAPGGSAKRPRIIYNDDGGSVVTLPHRVPMSVEQLTDLIDQFIGTQVDRYVFCVGNGRVACHASRVVDRAWEQAGGRYDSHSAYRAAENTRHLLEQGLDPPAVLAKSAKDAGIEYFLSLRMNDAHFAYSREGPEKSLSAGSFWRRHPDFRIGGDTTHYSRHLFDYSHAEVQQFRLAYIEECCRNYEVDGFELDFMRHPYYFQASEARRKCPIMTAFVEQVRELLHRIGQDKGRSIPLQVLVPRTLEAGLETGLDVAEWVKRKLVDVVVPKHYIQFNMEVPVEQFLKVTDGTSVDVYPCIEQRGYWGTGRDWNVYSDEKFRAAAARYWGAGARGLYLYNFFNHQPHPLCQADRAILQQIGEPDAIRLRDKHYFLMPASATDLAGEENQVPRTIDTRPEGHALLMTIGDDLEKARTLNLLKEVTLKLGIEGITPEVDEWDVTINGQLVPRDRQKCDPDSVVFMERWIEIDLTAGPYPIPGKNEIRLLLKKRNPMIRRELELTNVELLIRYH